MQSSKCLYSNSTVNINARDCSGSEFEDEWWFLEDRASPNDDLYRIRNKQAEDRCVYSNSDGRFSVYFCNPYSDQYWAFEVNPSNDSFFRIKNNKSKLSIDNVFYN